MRRTKPLGVSSKHVPAISCLETTGRVRHEDIRRVIAETLDCAGSLPDLNASESSAFGRSSGTSDYGSCSSSVEASSS